MRCAAIDEHLRKVAADEDPFDIRLRGSATFLPVSPVVFVPLVQGIADCERLEAKVRSGPLQRDIRFPYHPHVTVAHDLPADALDRAFAMLSTYEAAFRVARVHAVRAGRGRDLAAAAGLRLRCRRAARADERRRRSNVENRRFRTADGDAVPG